MTGHMICHRHAEIGITSYFHMRTVNQSMPLVFEGEKVQLKCQITNELPAFVVSTEQVHTFSEIRSTGSKLSTH